MVLALETHPRDQSKRKRAGNSFRERRGKAGCRRGAHPGSGQTCTGVSPRGLVTPEWGQRPAGEKKSLLGMRVSTVASGPRLHRFCPGEGCWESVPTESGLWECLGEPPKPLGRRRGCGKPAQRCPGRPENHAFGRAVRLALFWPEAGTASRQRPAGRPGGLSRHSRHSPAGSSRKRGSPP